MTKRGLHPRFAQSRLLEALADTPVVLIHGPRQCGKTTLARMVGDPKGYAYFSFDDPVALESAQSDPLGFVADLPEHSILDDVQKVPELFPALKTAVDRNRVSGRLLLTGSANVLLVPRLSESLAGRMEILRLHPLAQCELAGKLPRFLEILFGGRFKTRTSERLGPALAERIAAGGYPAALERAVPRRRLAWYRDYIETLVQRDVREPGAHPQPGRSPPAAVSCRGPDGPAAQREQSIGPVPGEPPDYSGLLDPPGARLPHGGTAAVACQPDEPAHQDAEAPRL